MVANVDHPWKKWIPGVLNRAQMKEICDRGFITGEGSLDEALDESSLDLSLSNEGYRMVQGSVKPPGTGSYGWYIQKEKLAERIYGTKIEPFGSEIFRLEAKSTYVFKLRERLFQPLIEGGIYGQA